MAVCYQVGAHRLASVAVMLAGVGLASGCSRPTESSAQPSAPLVGRTDAKEPASGKRIVAFCGACHPYPTADLFPKRNWEAEVRRGFDFYRKSDRRLDPPSIAEVIAHYEADAPESLPIIPRTPDGPGPARKLVREEIPGPHPDQPAAISHVSLVHLTDPKRPDILACDMAAGELLLRRAVRPNARAEVLASDLAHPAHATVSDLDRDGVDDILVADLGSPIPSDDRLGRVLWLRGRKEGGYETRILLSRLGRVCDVEPADFDGDGDLDLVVAVFGWHVAGEILLLEQRRSPSGSPEFIRRTLDTRHGTIHVPVVDLNRDGRPDFVALIAQEFETVVAFLNEGEGRFAKRTLFSAPHPAFGSSGIEMVDFDRDGDLDAVLSNGDVYDSPLIKPYHGVSWLENLGPDRPFARHEVGAFYGAQRALALDIDGDGDLDIVATSFLGEPYFGDQRKAVAADAVVLFEQTRPGEFRRHALERETCDYPTAAVGDLDGDGRQDIVVGRFRNFRFGGAAAGDPASGSNPGPFVIWK
ncbi:MAG: FG-GAP and VCBS repeat-containing protein [Isosphaeraceae bacterium]